MKTHHGGLEFARDLRGFRGERVASRPHRNRVRIDSELLCNTAPVQRRQSASRSHSRAGGTWQKKFTLKGLVVCALIAASSLRITSALSIAHGNDPSPPAFETAMASALPCTPAIGAWMIGSSMPSSCCSVENGIRRMKVVSFYYSGASVKASCTALWTPPPITGPPPATCIAPPTTAAPRPWRGVGIGAYASHRSVAES